MTWHYTRVFILWGKYIKHNILSPLCSSLWLILFNFHGLCAHLFWFLFPLTHPNCSQQITTTSAVLLKLSSC